MKNSIKISIGILSLAVIIAISFFVSGNTLKGNIGATIIKSANPTIIKSLYSYTPTGSQFTGWDVRLNVEGTNLGGLKYVTSNDPSLSNISLSGNTVFTIVNPTTQSGTKSVTFSNVDGTRQTVNFNLDLSKMPQPPVWQSPSSSTPTLSLSKPVLAWDTGDLVKSGLYKSNNGAPVYTYAYNIIISDASTNKSVILSQLPIVTSYDNQGVQTVEKLSNNFCNQTAYYGTKNIKTAKPYSNMWTCNNLTLPEGAVKNLVVGKTYRASVERITFNGLIYEASSSSIIFTAVK